MLLEWGEDLVLGHDEIDAQHRHLVELLNQLHETLFHQRNREALLKALAVLADFTRWHFDRESQIMLATGYPFAIEHLYEHDLLLQQINLIQHEFEQGTISLSPDFASFFRDWLGLHLRHADRPLRDYLRDQRSESAGVSGGAAMSGPPQTAPRSVGASGVVQ